MSAWLTYLHKLAICLESVTITDRSGGMLPLEDGLRAWRDAGSALRERKGCLFLVGNGASASLSSHFAADLSKNAGLRTCLFTDAALLTAIGNDLSFDRIFAGPLLRQGRRGDILLTISSSGNSPNILAAISAARQLCMHVITLSGMQATNKSRQLGDLNVYAPGATYGLVETAHAALLHFFTDQLVPQAPAAE